MIIAGVDEAGRGPVLGPLVMAAAACEEKDAARLVEIGVKDSKLLTPEKREELFKEVKKICTVVHSISPPTEVDEAVNSKKFNLNLLEAKHSCKLLDKLAKKVADGKKAGGAIDKAILDCPSTNIKKYTETIIKGLKTDMTVVCEHKADVNYPIVAAASIIAKVIRDREMKKISTMIDHDLGSGYMTDPKTHAWLQENFDGAFGFIRRSWASVKNLKDGKAQRSLFQYDAEHAAEIKEFDKLEEFGFTYVEPKNQYEVVRMKGPEHIPVTIIKFTTGKLTVQGNDRAKMKANALLQSVGLL